MVVSVTTLGGPHRGCSRSETLGTVQPRGEVSSPLQRGCGVPVPSTCSGSAPASLRAAAIQRRCGAPAHRQLLKVSDTAP